MAVHYRTFDGKSVSGRWRVVLAQARREGVRFKLNSGHRTLAEQTRMFKQNMRWDGRRWVQRPGRPLTAFPSPTAPHIRTGRAAHALDVNATDGGEARLQRWLESKGAHPTNPVRGEAWHMELSGGDLRKLWRRYRAGPKVEGMRVSQRGVDLIKSFEGFRSGAYKPVAKERYWTIGYGHYGPDVKRGQVVTRAEGERLLRKDLRKFEQGVDKLVTTRVNQNQFDALVSLAYNIGLGGFEKSTVLRMVNQRQFTRAAAAFHLWVRGAGGVKLPGLVRRRAAEARLFNKRGS